MKNEDIEAIYSSDLSRAKNTAFAIAALHGLNVVSDKRLREFNSGEKISSMNRSERWEWWDKEKRRQAKEKGVDPKEIKTPGGESEKDFYDRLENFLNDVKSKYKGTVVIVAHGGANKVMLCLLGYCSSEKSWEVMQKNTCVNELEVEEGKLKAVKINCLKHLE